MAVVAARFGCGAPKTPVALCPRHCADPWLSVLLIGN